MTYRTTAIIDRVRRRAIIEEQARESQQREREFYRDEWIECPVIRIPISIPVYRMQNGRTRVLQLSLVRTRGYDREFFASGEDNEAAQKDQHALLLELSKDPKASIYTELDDVAEQTEPLLVTVDGVVVNGNRRLAAMRDLLQLFPDKHSKFSYITVTVLPSGATEKDLEIIETRLQQKRDLRLPYSWINDRLKWRRQLELGFAPSEIKKAAGLKRDEDLNVSLQQLVLAEEYLDRYLGKPEAYEIVEHSEQLFADLQKALSGKSGDEAEVRRMVGFLLAKESGNLGTRVYDYNAVFGRDFAVVMNRLAEEEGVIIEEPLPYQVVSTEGVDDSDLLAQVIHRGTEIPGPVRTLLENGPQTGDIAHKIVSIAESVKLERKEGETKQLALRIAKDAHRLISRIDLSKAEPSTHAELKGQLKGIEEKCAILLSGLR